MSLLRLFLAFALSMLLCNAAFAADPIAVALIFDESGSMAWEDPSDLRHKAGQLFVDLMDDSKDSASVIKFATSAVRAQSMTKTQSSLKSAITSSSSVDGGGTCYLSPLTYGSIDLANSDSYADNRRAAVLFTDGDPQDEGSYDDILQYYKENGWRIYCMGFGGATATVLSNISGTTGGYTKMVTVSNLEKEMLALIYAIRGKSAPTTETGIVEGPDYHYTKEFNLTQSYSYVKFFTVWGDHKVNFYATNPSGSQISGTNNGTNGVIDVTKPSQGTWTLHVVSQDPVKVNFNITLGMSGEVIPSCGTPSYITVPSSSDDGSFEVRWGASSTSGVTYVLQEANSNNPSSWSTVKTTTATSHLLTSKTSGLTYYYRVKATKSGYIDSGYANGSNGCVVTIVNLPSVTTVGVNSDSITARTATVNGRVDSDGNGTLVNRGICWGTSQNPTGNCVTAPPYQEGAFSANLTKLPVNTKIYVRAFAVNEKGRKYGFNKDFTTKMEPPEITFHEPSKLTSGSARIQAEVTYDGGGDITAVGVCWSENEEPGLHNGADCYFYSDSDKSGFDTTLENGLDPSTEYHMRAFAVNAQHEAYSTQEFVFHTLPQGAEITFNVIGGTNNFSFSSVNTVSIETQVGTSRNYGNKVTYTGKYTYDAYGTAYSDYYKPKKVSFSTGSGSAAAFFESFMSAERDGNDSMFTFLKPVGMRQEVFVVPFLKHEAFGNLSSAFTIAWPVGTSHQSHLDIYESPTILVHGLDGMKSWHRGELYDAANWNGSLPAFLQLAGTDTWVVTYPVENSLQEAAFLLGLAIREIRSRYASAPTVNIVTHGTGALVFRALLQDMASTGDTCVPLASFSLGVADFNRIVYLAPPFQGSALALHASQDAMGDKQARTRAKQHFHKWVGRTELFRQFFLTNESPSLKDAALGSGFIKRLQKESAAFNSLGANTVVIAGGRDEGTDLDDTAYFDDGMLAACGANLDNGLLAAAALPYDYNLLDFTHWGMIGDNAHSTLYFSHFLNISNFLLFGTEPAKTTMFLDPEEDAVGSFALPYANNKYIHKLKKKGWFNDIPLLNNDFPFFYANDSRPEINIDSGEYEILTYKNKALALLSIRAYSTTVDVQTGKYLMVAEDATPGASADTSAFADAPADVSDLDITFIVRSLHNDLVARLAVTTPEGKVVSSTQNQVGENATYGEEDDNLDGYTDSLVALTYAPSGEYILDLQDLSGNSLDEVSIVADINGTEVEILPWTPLNSLSATSFEFTPDIIAPAAVTDLSVAQHAESNMVRLQWTAPADNDGGAVERYEIRYATETITSDNWQDATELLSPPWPLPPGMDQVFDVIMPAPGTGYHFALVSYDASGNVSALSNTAGGSSGPGGEITGDDTAPDAPVVEDEGDLIPATRPLYFSWSATDEESGIAGYYYAVGTSPYAVDIKDWVFTTDTSVRLDSLLLFPGKTYFCSVKALNGAGGLSAAGTSDGISIEGTAAVTLHASVSGEGTVTAPGAISCPGDCDEVYLAGTEVTLTATPDDGHRFRHWSDDCSGEDPVLSFTIEESTSCQANFTPKIPPVVETVSYADVTTYYATVNGDVTDGGGEPVTERGICWGLAAEPTDTCQPAETDGTGAFSVTIGPLPPETTIYARAYAINALGPGYGEDVTFDTPNGPPFVRTGEAEDVTHVAAVIPGELVYTGGADVEERGICFGAATAPTDCTQADDTDSFSVSYEGLEPETTYYARAYAKNAQGLSYGNEIDFSTRPLLPEIRIVGNGIVIANNDDTPDTQDNTDMGTIDRGESGTAMFTIANPGTASLELTGTPLVAVSGDHADDFSVKLEPASPVAASPLQELAYDEQLVAGSVKRPVYVRSADMDNDGDLDLAVVELGSESISWWENTKGDASTWLRHSILGGIFAYSLCIQDFDNDGDMDVATAGNQYYNGTLRLVVIWAENLGEGAAWEYHVLGSCSSRIYSMAAADMDNDGDMDIVLADNSSNLIKIYENQDAATWNEIIVATDFSGAYAIDVCDLNNDDKMDILGVARGSKEVAWWERTDTLDSSWTKHTVATNLYDPTIVLAADINGDGQLDVVSGPVGVSLDLTWWSNDDGTGLIWTAHNIPSDTTSGVFPADCLDAADMDGDGDKDIVAGASQWSQNYAWSDLAIFENTAGDGSSWTASSLTNSFNDIWCLELTDFDQDGDNDIIAVGDDVSKISWWKNSLITGSMFSLVFTPSAVGTRTATISISSNVPDTPVYSFAVQGSADPALPFVSTAEPEDVLITTATAGGEVLSDNGAEIMERGFCIGQEAAPRENCLPATGTDVGAFTLELSELEPYTTYHVAAYAANSVGTAYGDDVSFTTLDLPRAVTSSVESITTSSARYYGQVAEDYGAEVTERGFCVGAAPSPTDCTPIASAGLGGMYYDDSGLTPGTTYYVRAYAINTGGTGYGDDISFTTKAVLPSVTTGEVSNLKNTSVTIGGEVTASGGATVTERGICLGDGSSNVCQSAATAGLGAYTVDFSGLKTNTEYVTRAYAKNSVGTAYGVYNQFTTHNTLPVATTGEITDVTYKSAVVAGEATVEGDGGDVTERGICLGTSAGPTACTAASSAGSGVFSVDFSELDPSTTYYVRAYAVNDAGTAYGEDGTFVTTDGLVAYYPFNGNANDESPNENNGTPHEAFLTTDRFGNAESAYYFDGETSYIDCGNDASLNLTEGITVSAWINPTSKTATRYIVAKGSATAEDKGYRLLLTENDLRGAFDLQDGTESSVQATPDDFSAQRWFHVLTTFDGTSATLYLNGKLIASQDTAGSLGTGPGKLILGMLSADTPNEGRFSGKIDEVRIYKRVLSKTEATALYAAENGSTSPKPPLVVTKPAEEIGSASATIRGWIAFEGGAKVTKSGICYGTEPAPRSNCLYTPMYTYGTFGKYISGLEENTTYYAAAFAMNSAGTAYGEDVSFTTALEVVSPTVATDGVSGVTSSSVTAGGTVLTDGNADIVERGICIGLKDNPTDCTPADDAGLGGFTVAFSGLSRATTYYVRAYAKNSGYFIGYGDTMTFATSAALPTVTTYGWDDVTESTASVIGIVEADGGATVTSRGICLGTSPNPTDCTPDDEGGTGNFRINFTELQHATEYYVRAFATNSAGTGYGEDLTFTTSGIAPSVTTDAANDVHIGSATISGEVTDDGGEEVTERGICLGRTSNPLYCRPADTGGPGSYSVHFSELEHSTTYYARAYAINSVDTSYGENITFTTKNELPIVTTGSATYVNEDSARVSGAVAFDGGGVISECGICYGTAADPRSSCRPASIMDAEAFTVQLTSLDPDTMYYAAAYATNGAGTTYGNTIQFKTLTDNTVYSIPTLQMLQPSIFGMENSWCK